MRCSKVRKLMFKFFEEDLTDKQIVEIKEHLKDCPWCMSEYKKAKKMMDVVTSEKPKMIPDGLHKNIMIDINGMNNFIVTERKENRRTFKIVVRRVAVACLAVFIAIYALTFVNFDIIKDGIKNGFTKLTLSDEKVEIQKSEDDIFYDLAGFGKLATKERANNEVTDVNEEEFSSEDSINSVMSMQATSTESDILATKGFFDVNNYSEYLDNDNNVTKKSMIELYTLYFEDSMDKVNEIANKYNANIYYSNISYNDNDDGFRTGVFALRVVRDNFNKLKKEIEHLGSYDINVMQDEFKVETTEDLNVLLIHCKDNKIELENKLENLDKNSDTYESDKASLQEQIEAENASIENIETSLQKLSTNIEVIKLELTLKECSELELEGILTGKVFGRSIIKAMKTGWSKFVRMLQNAFLWICENVLFIIFFVLLFSLLYFLLKLFFLKRDDD